MANLQLIYQKRGTTNIRHFHFQSCWLGSATKTAQIYSLQNMSPPSVLSHARALALSTMLQINYHSFHCLSFMHHCIHCSQAEPSTCPGASGQKYQLLQPLQRDLLVPLAQDLFHKGKISTFRMSTHKTHQVSLARSIDWRSIVHLSSLTGLIFTRKWFFHFFCPYYHHALSTMLHITLLVTASAWTPSTNSFTIHEETNEEDDSPEVEKCPTDVA